MTSLTRYDVLTVLCRNTLAASIAPGQPPRSDPSSKFFSEIRRLPPTAARLSQPYIANVTELVAAIQRATQAGLGIAVVIFIPSFFQFRPWLLAPAAPVAARRPLVP